MHHGDILAVRSRFLSTGTVPDGVPTPLVRSWQRSSRFGFASPTLARQRDRLEDGGLRGLKERNADLIASSLEEMASLANELSALGGVVILTDPNGIVLNRLGGGGFSDDADRLGLNEGVDWSENAIGTNAIGTVALEMGWPVDHWCRASFLPQHVPELLGGADPRSIWPAGRRSRCIDLLHRGPRPSAALAQARRDRDRTSLV